ncbi:MAG: hypothetical protein AAF547_15055 [Actinomycetota bacterium]
MRIALITQRAVKGGTGQFPAYGAWTEAEDVLIGCIEADLVPLTLPIESTRVRIRRQAGRAVRRVTGPATPLPRSLSARRTTGALSGRYDAAIFMAHSIWDLQLVERLGNLRRWADTVAVWFLETWPSSYVDGMVTLEPFHAVDHIFVGMDAAVEPLAAALGREVTYLPMASDTLRFGPERPDTERPIDLIGIGRRRPEQHDSMLRWAGDTGRLYLYDTTRVGRPADLDSHRDTIGGWYKNAKLATCNYAKNDEPSIVGDYRVMPGRLWEGLAAGTSLVGLAPSEESQRALFGRTVVTPVPDHPSELPIFLEDQIERHDHTAVAAQIQLALSGHDWAHRWSAMLDHLGLGPSPGLDRRIAQLAERAEKFS